MSQTVKLLFVVYTEPGQVSNLKTTPLSETSSYISWAQPQRLNGIILYYEISVTGGIYMMTNNYTTLNATLDGFGRQNDILNYDFINILNRTLRSLHSSSKSSHFSW